MTNPRKVTHLVPSLRIISITLKTVLQRKKKMYLNAVKTAIFLFVAGNR